MIHQSENFQIFEASSISDILTWIVDSSFRTLFLTEVFPRGVYPSQVFFIKVVLRVASRKKFFSA